MTRTHRNQPTASRKPRKSRARPRYENTVYTDVRRTLGRRMRFTPDAETANIFGYTLALATQKYGIKVSAYCIMATHPHILVTDEGANFSSFKQFLNSNIARAMNERHQMTGQFWDHARVDGERILLDPMRSLTALSYVMLNPVKQLVDDWREWRDVGMLAGPEEWWKRLTFTRPPYRFRETPEEVELILEPIPGVELSVDEVVDWIDRGQVLERQLREPAGLSSAQSRHHFDQSKGEILKWANSEEGDAYRIGELIRRSRLAGECRTYQSTDPVALRDAHEELQQFEEDHATAIAAFAGGHREVSFPDGTDKMRWFNVKIVRSKRRVASSLVSRGYDNSLRGPPVQKS